MPGLACDDFKVNTTGITIRVQNGLGKDLDWINVSVSGTATNCIAGSFNQSLNDGVVSTFSLPCPGGVSAGTRFKEDLVIAWKESGSSLTHSRTGQLVGEVEA